MSGKVKYFEREDDDDDDDDKPQRAKTTIDLLREERAKRTKAESENAELRRQLEELKKELSGLKRTASEIADEEDVIMIPQFPPLLPPPQQLLQPQRLEEEEEEEEEEQLPLTQPRYEQQPQLAVEDIDEEEEEEEEEEQSERYIPLQILDRPIPVPRQPQQPRQQQQQQPKHLEFPFNIEFAVLPLTDLAKRTSAEHYKDHILFKMQSNIISGSRFDESKLMYDNHPIPVQLKAARDTLAKRYMDEKLKEGHVDDSLIDDVFACRVKIELGTAFWHAVVANSYAAVNHDNLQKILLALDHEQAWTSIRQNFKYAKAWVTMTLPKDCAIVVPRLKDERINKKKLAEERNKRLTSNTFGYKQVPTLQIEECANNDDFEKFGGGYRNDTALYFLPRNMFIAYGVLATFLFQGFSGASRFADEITFDGRFDYITEDSYTAVVRKVEAMYDRMHASAELDRAATAADIASDLALVETQSSQVAKANATMLLTRLQSRIKLTPNAWSNAADFVVSFENRKDPVKLVYAVPTLREFGKKVFVNERYIAYSKKTGMQVNADPFDRPDDNVRQNVGSAEEHFAALSLDEDNPEDVLEEDVANRPKQESDDGCTII